MQCWCQFIDEVFLQSVQPTISQPPYLKMKEKSKQGPEDTAKRYRLEPPEGGWGYLVGIGMALPFICAFSSMPCFGLIYNDFLKQLGEGTSAVAVITSSFFSAMSFAGLFSNTLFNKFSMRKVGLVGGIMYFVGALFQIFVQSTTQLFVGFSLLQGAAIGLIIPTAYTLFNHYFVERRVMMMSIAQSIIGVGIMFYPVLTQKLMEWYGFRGCLAVLAAISSHAIFGMLCMHPVEWHMRKVPIPEDELDSPELNGKATIDMHHLEPLMEDIVSKPKPRKSVDTAPNSRLASALTSRRPSSIASMGNWTGPVILSEAMEYSPKPGGKWQYLVDFLDLTLLKDAVYVNIVLGISFALYSDIAFLTIQPMYLFEIGFTEVETANIIAMGAAADLFSRVFLAVSSAFVSVPSRYVYLAGSLFSIVARTAFLTVFDFRGVAIMTIIIGFLKTWLHVPLPLVFAEYLSKERFPSGYGLFMFLQGNIMFIVGPIVGYIRDATKSYEISFHCLNFFMAACAFPWIIEIVYLKCRNRWRRRRESVALRDEN
ncbi:monocarboxylate transporter 9 isoform X2 [Hermetia illucens]|uniref:monocarboxylate transporter 9 isoform X2 n=1 Tax=Hermetia illucens TaxID=343691 RepID=UPI0018CBF61A|nr:monocarboxylate transporter 9 isoform X2 [Hermetia illucens]